MHYRSWLFFTILGVSLLSSQGNRLNSWSFPERYNYSWLVATQCIWCSLLRRIQRCTRGNLLNENSAGAEDKKINLRRLFFSFAPARVHFAQWTILVLRTLKKPRCVGDENDATASNKTLETDGPVFQYQRHNWTPRDMCKLPSLPTPVQCCFGHDACPYKLNVVVFKRTLKEGRGESRYLSSSVRGFV